MPADQGAGQGLHGCYAQPGRVTLTSNHHLLGGAEMANSQSSGGDRLSARPGNLT
jgi:hypothetical protein